MSFDELERSINDGSRTELYAFSYGVKRYLYTTNEVAVSFNSETFEPLSMQRSKISLTTERGKNDITVTVPRDCAVATIFSVAPPTQAMSLTLFRTHRDLIAGAKPIWIGRVVNAKWNEDQTAELLCESFYTSMGRMGLRRGYGRQCPHTLFDTECQLEREDYYFTSAASGISRLSMTVAGADAFSDGYFNGGVVAWQSDSTGVIERRMISKHVGTSITVTHHITSIGSDVTLLPGCAHNADDCKNKFNNKVNYGGFLFMPDVNPFGGSTIF